jgi:hypothetical protein
MIETFRQHFRANERAIAVGFFIAGFVFDMLTLGRIDSWIMIGQQIAYLAIVAGILAHMLLEQGAVPAPDPEQMTGLKRWYYRYRTAAVHFVLGALLNLYTLFFFKSSSLAVSFAFLGVLAGLVLANESSRFKSLGLHFKFALLSLCLLCFFAALVPVVVGSIGLAVFLLSLVVGCLPLVAAAVWIRRAAPEHFPRARQQMLMPLGCVLLIFLVFYLFRLIPPVPLSIPFIGVYHGVERTNAGYTLSHERPVWRVWQNGDQNFRAQPGDKVYVFFRLFSPSGFSDQVVMRWHLKEPKRGWTLQDSIPIKIVGGREEGFRGYGFKSNYQAGAWKVLVETGDGREIGRVYFDLELVPESTRSFAQEPA